jgi:hypothetical protein
VIQAVQVVLTIILPIVLFVAIKRSIQIMRLHVTVSLVNSLIVLQINAKTVQIAVPAAYIAQIFVLSAPQLQKTI